MPAVRAAGWVVALSLLAALALAAVAAGGGRTWRELGGALPPRPPRSSPGRSWSSRCSPAAPGRAAGAGSARAARGALLAALLLAVFVPLLVAADAAFAELVDDLW